MTQDESQLYKVELEQGHAKDLLRIGGFLLLLDVPEGTVIGLDRQSCIVSRKFRGFKMIPPGAHVLHYNGLNKERELSATVSQFLHLASKQITVLRWNVASELLLPLDDEDEEQRYRAGVMRMDFDAGMAPYNVTAYPAWRSLSSHITAATIDRLQPTSKLISITAESGPLIGASAAEQDLDAQLANVEISSPNPARGDGSGSSQIAKVGRCHYIDIPRIVKRHGLTPEEITRHQLDKSLLLRQLLCKLADPNELLGELQFAFLAFLCGQSLEGFAQWKKLLHLLLRCEEYPLKEDSGSDFFARAVQAIEAQIAGSIEPSKPGVSQSSPSANLIGLEMLDGVLADSFLHRLFQQFFQTMAGSSEALKPSLMDAIQKLKDTIHHRLGWDFRITDSEEDDDEENQPVIVDL